MQQYCRQYTDMIQYLKRTGELDSKKLRVGQCDRDAPIWKFQADTDTDI